ncbi:MAG: hypothetical protein QW279_09575 [Candidatus Jordarchaeaceae archaeon]
MSKPSSNTLDEAIPYVSELESQILRILRKNPENKEKVKEILEKYATKYSTEFCYRA